MRNRQRIVFVVLSIAALLAASCASRTDVNGNLGDGSLPEPVRQIPDATWVTFFFEAIDERAERAGLDPLRIKRLPAQALEVRVWKGFGLRPLEGYVLRRDAPGQWRVWHLTMGPDAASRAIDADGEVLFARLADLGLLTLPDSSTLPDERIVTDGTSYVVEVHTGDTYRTYHYGNPAQQVWPEAEKMVRIGAVLEAAVAEG